MPLVKLERLNSALCIILSEVLDTLHLLANDNMHLDADKSEAD